MSQSNIIHTYKEAGYEAFWRTFYVIVLAIGILIGIALAAFPVYLYLKYQSVWLFILFVFIPLGFWMAKGMLRHLRKLMWHDNHLSTFVLHENKIEATEWVETFNKEPVEREVPFTNISEVIVSYYVIRQTLSTAGFGAKTITENAPILYIVYSKNGKREMLNIPFPSHGDPVINVWLSHFRKRGIPLQYTARKLYRKDTQILSDKKRLDYFESSEELIDFPFSASWDSDEPEALKQWREKEAELQAEEKTQKPAHKKFRRKHTFKTWISTVWLVFMIMFLAVYIYTKFGGYLLLSTGNLIPGLVIFILGGLLFFYRLRSYLRWYYMVTFSLIAFIVGLFIRIMSESMPVIAPDFGMSIFVAALLYPALVWIPYFTIKKVTINNRSQQ